MKKQSKHKKTALYCRLSKDDGKDCESSSIKNQKLKLQNYANEKDFEVFSIYIDDGWSGMNFNRPDFIRMMNDVELGYIDTIIIKDFSRLGRDYIRLGDYTEVIFPNKGIRFISIDDNYDSQIISNYNDFIPFKNMVNEMVVRDTSRKINSALQTKMADGQYIGNFPPYGYQKNEINKNKLIIDENVSGIVIMIFKMAMEGAGPTEIAKYLNTLKIPTPSEYRCIIHSYLDINNYSKRKEWTAGTINNILKNEVYIGHSLQGKTKKISLKSKKSVAKPKTEWIVVKNTHEPIVDEKVFEIVRSKVHKRTNNKKGEFNNLFSGLAKCSDCGRNMSSTISRKKGCSANLVCGGYKGYGISECTNHFIDYDELYQVVLNKVREYVKEIQNDKNIILDSAYLIYNEHSKSISVKENNMQFLKRKMEEIDQKIKHLYNDNMSGKINDERFIKLMNCFENEQNQLRHTIFSAQYVENSKAKETNYLTQSQFMDVINGYLELEKLSNDIVSELIERIEIGQGHYEVIAGKRIKKQEINIFFRFMPKFWYKNCTI